MPPEWYEIRVEGILPSDWSSWFEGLEIRCSPHGESILSGSLADQAALHGVLAKIRNLNIKLISVSRGGPSAQHFDEER
ncbi:MAG TPA: hypothetical protein PLJ35_05920 [Anaerolineae bacterium]|nr:hypothetical protein [Anaerolineae bacterium]HOQ98341.1 hypothetical protein [Anaerolineae bacterium]HPL26574.1 hypothetical protein [Anaerolineae bacterium]